MTVREWFDYWSAFLAGAMFAARKADNFSLFSSYLDASLELLRLEAKVRERR